MAQRKHAIIVVSNRLPIRRVGTGPRAEWERSPGGLVTAMTPVLHGRRGAWVGWAGAAGTPRGPGARVIRHDGLRMHRVEISETELEGYYRGMSNSTIWPLYHDALQPPEFHRNWWRAYLKVNIRFARAVARVARPSDRVWVHDYHLQLVPGMLRKLRPELRIGFFLHIPFPPEELFEWLPWREHVLRGLMGADVVGFQTQAGATNFSRLVRRFLPAEGTDASLAFEGRTVTVRAFPISIDTPAFMALAESPEVARRAAEIRARVGARRRVLLAVDRIDYTKGIDIRLRAFEEMLRRGKVTAEDCVLVQIAVPGRDATSLYRRLRTDVEQLVGRINGMHSQPGRVAVHYFRRSLAHEELAAYYRAADVMLVTPLRDGMNLVSKEYVASRADGSGVLVLSEFAGASRELRRALLVNPRDLDQMVATMERAVRMPAREARFRMGIMRMIVRRHTVHEWASDFLGVLG
jgi:trehalose 6-phosphate synthase